VPALVGRKVKIPVDDSRYAPCHQSDTREGSECNPRRGCTTRSASVKDEAPTTIAQDANELALRVTLKDIGLELQECVDKGSYAAVYKAVSVGNNNAGASTDVGDPNEVGLFKLNPVDP
jgi:hypothetical protein